jgi:hypothetical protein
MNACTKRSLSWVAVVAVLAGVLWFSPRGNAAPTNGHVRADMQAKQAAAAAKTQQPQHASPSPNQNSHHPVQIHDPLRRIYYRNEVEHIHRTEDITRNITIWRWGR